MKERPTVDLYDLLETRIEPILQQWVAELRAEFPNVKPGVYGPTYHPDNACDIGISCLLQDAPDDQPDEVDLDVHLSPTAMESGSLADVSWGHPSGAIEAELLPRHRESIEDVFRELEEDLPALCEVLRNAIRRGVPPPSLGRLV